MKKITKATKAPAPAPKTAAPTPVRKSTVEPKIKKSIAAPTAATGVLAKPRGLKVTITAMVDIGFGNTLFIRGDGAGLSWAKGRPLAWAPGGWTLVLTDVQSPFDFKFLINDERWSAEPNYAAAPGDTVTVGPIF
jgi:hypothetical protein